MSIGYPLSKKWLPALTTVLVVPLLVAGPPAHAAPGDPTWGTPTDLSATGGSASSPQVVASTDGTKLTTIWTRSNGTNNIIQARSSTDSGATWGATTNLSATGQNASSPQVVASTDGTKLTAIWSRNNGTNLIVQARTSTDSGATWGTTTDLSATGQNGAAPQLVASTDGTKLTAIWFRNNGTHIIVQARTSTDSGATWGTTTNLSATGQNANSPQVAASADGTKLTAIWFRFNGTNNIIQARTSTDSGATWGATTDLSATGQNASAPQLVASTDGTKLTAIWSRSDGTNTIIQARTSTDSGATWSAATDLSATGRSASAPQLAASTDGTKLTTIWSRSDGTKTIIQARTSTDSGATWGTTTDLSATGQNAGSPQVAASTDGAKLTAIWFRSNGTNNIIQARTSTDSGATWSAAADLSATGQNAGSPQLATSTDGTKLTAIWSRNNGSESIVQTASGVIPQAQTISFGALSNVSLGAGTRPVSATATSGLTVAFNSQTPAVCTVSGTTVTLLTTGTCTVQATQSGNVNYTAAAPVDQSFTVTSNPAQVASANRTGTSVTWTPITGAAQYYVVYRQLGSGKPWGVYATGNNANNAELLLTNPGTRGTCSAGNTALNYTSCPMAYGFAPGKTYEFSIYTRDASGKTSRGPLGQAFTYTP